MNIRVLAVDDSATFRHWLSQILMKAGIDVEQARSGAEAIGKLGDGHNFDVVITDLRMPGVDGSTLVKTIQRCEELVPVIVLTSSEDDEEHVRNLDAGASAFITKPKANNQSSVEAIVVATVRGLARKKNRETSLKQDSRTDQLTQLLNRRHGGERLQQELDRHHRYGQAFAVAMLDIDHFKTINDTLGHAAGDDVLVKVAEELKKISRQSDIVIRWGGEEFLFAFPGTGLLQAAAIVERFRQHLWSAPLTVRAAEKNVAVTISGGVAECQQGDTLDALVERADIALYKAKSAGRNRLIMWQSGKLEPVTSA
jgi:diguanylate cyclase (GGDEF)-like protein